MSKFSKPMLRNHKLSKGKLIAFGGLLFSLGVVTSVTATYAYYNLTMVGAISNLNLSITNDQSYLKLWLSKDPSKTLDELVEDVDLIHREDGYTKEDLGIEGITLNDVSGMNQNNWFKNGEALNDPLALPKLMTAPRSFKDPRNPGYEENDTFVQNVFYLESNFSCTVYLDGGLDENNIPYTHIKANQEENMKVASETGRPVEKLNEVVHAVRVSFLTDEGYIIANPGESENTLYGGLLDLGVDGYFDYDSENREIMYGEYEGEVSYIKNTGDEKPYEDGNVFNANHKPGVDMVDLSKLNIKQEEAVKLDTLRYEVDKPLKKVTPICTLEKGVKKRIVVTIYVEGWDKHMTDDIASASFDVALAFTALLDQ